MDNFNIFNYNLPWPLISAFFIVCVVYILWLEHDKKDAMIKEEVPKFPGGTFAYLLSDYKRWKRNLIKYEGWTKEEIERGYRWTKLK